MHGARGFLSMNVTPATGDAALTAARSEVKYRLPLASLSRLRAELDARLLSHHHGASPVAAMMRHYTTTVYFDTADRQLCRAAVAGGEHVKLRAREYYDLLPLAELATDESELLRSQPIVWLELKRRAGDHSAKRRVGVPKYRLVQFLQSPGVDPELRSIQRRSLGAEGDEVLGEMLEFLGQLSAPVQTSAIVNYARSAWQDERGAIRVTVDEELAAFAPYAGMWQRDLPLTRRFLGRPARAEPLAIIEVKHLGSSPAWLTEALAGFGAVRSGYSKFQEASIAIYGPCES